MTTITRANGASTPTPAGVSTTRDLTHLHPYLTATDQIDAHDIAMGNIGIRSWGGTVEIRVSKIDRLQQVVWGVDGILAALAMEDDHTLRLGDYIRGGLQTALRALVQEGLAEIASELTTAANKAEAARRDGGAA